MLVIRDEQMQALREVVRSEFERKLVLHFRETRPDETRRLSDGELRARVREGVERAAARGIITRNAVRSLVESWLFHPADPPADPRSTSA